MPGVCLPPCTFICTVLHFLFFRVGRGDQTVWSASWMGAQVPFRNHNELTSPATQPGRRPESVDSHSCCITQRHSGMHLRTNLPSSNQLSTAVPGSSLERHVNCWSLPLKASRKYVTSLTLRNIAIVGCVLSVWNIKLYFKQHGVVGKSPVSEKCSLGQMCAYWRDSCKVEPCLNEMWFMQNVQDIVRVYKVLTVNVF